MAELDLILGSKDIERTLREMDEDPDKYLSEFLGVQVSYGSRNTYIDDRNDLFEGKHWLSQKGSTTSVVDTPKATTDVKDTEYELVLNYLRNTTMRYAAMLCRRPLPHVPFPGSGNSPLASSANRCERFLHAVWPDLWRVWRDVELDACKLSFGVFHAIWSPFEGQPESVQMGSGEDSIVRKVYTRCPFKFRSVKPNNFFPIYRTYDTPNDFLTVYRYDPGRLVKDLEERYGVDLQPTGQDTFTLPTADLLEVWTKDLYLLIAFTQISTVADRRTKRTIKRGYTVIEAGKNPHKRIPFWVLQNIRSNSHKNPTDGGSYADLDDIGDLNKHLEEMMSEHSQEIATHIHAPIIYKSEEHLNDPASIKFKPGAVFPIGAEEEIETLAWNPDPAGVGAHLDRIFASIQDLSFLGEAGFGRLAAGMSGIGFKIALSPMEQILELKLPNRVDALKEISQFLLTEFSEHAGDTPFQGWIMESLGAYGVAELSADDVPPVPTVEIQFPNLLPRDDQLHEQSEVYKWKTGAQSLLTTMHNMGIEDPVREVERIKEELQDPILSPDHVMKLKQLEMIDKQQQAQGQAAGGQPGQPGQPQPGQTGQPAQGGAFGSNIKSGPPQQTMGGGMGGIGGVPGGMGGMGGPGAMGMQQGGMPGAGGLPGQMSGVGMPPGAGGAGGAGGGDIAQMLASMMQGGGGGMMPGMGGEMGMPGGGTGPQMPLGQMGGPNFPTQEQGTRRNAPFMKRK